MNLVLDPGKGFTFSVTELVEGDFIIKDNGNVSISGIGEYSDKY